MDMRIFLVFFPIFIFISCQKKELPKERFDEKMRITESMVFEQDTLRIPVYGGEAAIEIEGKNIEVDFNNTVLIGVKKDEKPNRYAGAGISIKGKNITVKNAIVQGYQTAIRAVNSDSLKIMDCDLSVNYKYYEGDETRNHSAVALKLLSCNFSKIYRLKIEGCENAIFLGGSKFCELYNNEIRFNTSWGVALHAADSNKIMHNKIDWNGTGLSLVSSDGNYVFNNSLTHNERLAVCTGNQEYNRCTSNIFSENNYSYSFEAELDSLKFYEEFSFENEPPLFSDGMSTALDSNLLQGRKYILKNKWGIYNFKYPSIWLRNVEGNKYTFLLYGPPTGNYKIIDGEGWEKLNRVTGAFPATLIATAKPEAEKLSLELEFIGQEFIDQYGQVNKKGKVYPFRWEEDRVESRE